MVCGLVWARTEADFEGITNALSPIPISSSTFYTIAPPFKFDAWLNLGDEHLVQSAIRLPRQLLVLNGVSSFLSADHFPKCKLAPDIPSRCKDIASIVGICRRMALEVSGLILISSRGQSGLCTSRHVFLSKRTAEKTGLQEIPTFHLIWRHVHLESFQIFITQIQIS